jgi:hypothetical protein
MPLPELIDYFTAEKQGGILLGCLGLGLLVEAAVLLAFDSKAFRRAMMLWGTQ